MSLKVAVICGGPSPEADVSRKSAVGVVGALNSAGHTVSCHELNEQLAATLVQTKPDVVFPITHGAVGEDGCLQGLLEVLNLPYVGCAVLASAVAANKPVAKQLWRSRGLPVASELVVTRRDDVELAAEHARKLGPAVVIKPAHGGSAIGVYHATETQPPSEWARCIREVLAIDEEALVEPKLTGLEVTCGVLEDKPGEPRALPPTIIEPKRADFYDFVSKYAPGGSQHLCPAPLQPSTFARVQQLAVLAHRTIGARDLSRVDFFVDEQVAPAAITILEINTLPGMTATSLYPEAAGVVGLSFAELCDRLVKLAAARPVRPAPQVEQIPT